MNEKWGTGAHGLLPRLPEGKINPKLPWLRARPCRVARAPNLEAEARKALKCNHATSKKVRKREKGQKSALEYAEHGLNLYNPCGLNEDPESRTRTAVSNVRKEANTKTKRAPMLYIVDVWLPAGPSSSRHDFCNQLIFYFCDQNNTLPMEQHLSPDVSN